MDLSSHKNLFMIFLLLRLLTAIGLGYTSSLGSAFSYTAYVIGLVLLISLILVYMDNKIGAFLFSIFAVVETLLNFGNITNLAYLPSLLVWRVYGIYLAYRTVEEINQNNARAQYT